MMSEEKNPSNKRATTDAHGHKEKFALAAEPFFREVEVEFLVHELKGPISVMETGIRALLEKRKQYGSLTSRQEKTLQRSLRNAVKARGMLNGLLEIGRSQAGCFVCCRFQPAKTICDVLSETLETLPGELLERFHEGGKVPEDLSRYNIFLNISPQLVDIEMLQDELKFRQIFGNLIKNALHHRKERIDIEMNQVGEHLHIDVSDDGPGINPEHHEWVFRRYTQVNECGMPLSRPGHGLGLAGASIMARCLGGNIELKSESGKGARFRLILPVSLEMES